MIANWNVGLPGGHPGSHQSVLRDYAFPGSATTIHWDEQDRRNFRGDWFHCNAPACILPLNHRGNHAT